MRRDESAKLCGATCGLRQMKGTMTDTWVDSQVALFSPAARVTMAVATARVWSPRVANWGR
jgi:hypothetical protein